MAIPEIYHTAVNEHGEHHPDRTQTREYESPHGRPAEANAAALHMDSEGAPAGVIPKSLDISHVGKRILLPFSYVYIFCMFISFSLLIPARKRDPSPEQATPQPTSLARRIYRNIREQTRSILGPPVFWAPAALLLLAIITTRRASRDHQTTSYGNVADLRAGCALDGRRTQTGTFVKLFAATVTTMAIQGHLGSLQGSRAWNWEVLRVVDVLFAPLKTIYTLARALYLELTSDSIYYARHTPNPLGIRYRLARLCNAGLELCNDRSSPWIGTVNPVHVCCTSLPYDVKWAGRVFILVAAASQYTSSLILLVRRFQSDTNAAVDTAKLVLVICGTVDLVKSLLLLAGNSRWNIPHDGEFTPCLDKWCDLDECVAFKEEQGAPNAALLQARDGFTGSYKLAPYLQWLLLSLVGSNLLRVVLSVSHDKDVSFWKEAFIMLAIRQIWEIGLRSLYSLLGAYDLAKGINLDTEPRRQDDGRENPLTAQDQEEETTIPSDVTLPVTDRSTTTRCGEKDVLLGVVLATVGFVMALFGLVAILFQFVLLVMPSTILLALSVGEMSTWAAWPVNEPCPQLWKDELEDLLWSF
ncbi:hypothetical protein V8F33_002292 [Rhypophila sp. PSN 637]